jgi:hypothetical protein
MLTMHPVLQVGQFDHDFNPLAVGEWAARQRALEDAMRAKGWRALIAYGNRTEYGDLSWLTGYAPRLGDALLLVAPGRRPRILSFEGVRMVVSGRETTGIAEVEPVADLPGMIAAWLRDVGGEGSVAISSFAIMTDELHGVLAAVPALAGAVDGSGALLDLRRRKSAAEIELMTANAATLAAMERAIRDAVRAGAAAREALLAGEMAAVDGGMQDIRSLFSTDGCRTFLPGEFLPDEAVSRLTLYVALRRWGYWVEGFMTIAGAPAAEMERARNMVDAATAAARAGAPCPPLDVGAGGSFIGPGHGLGASPGELPLLAASGATLEKGDVISIRAVAGNAAGDRAVASAMLAIGPQGARTLWREQS